MTATFTRESTSASSCSRPICGRTTQVHPNPHQASQGPDRDGLRRLRRAYRPPERRTSTTRLEVDSYVRLKKAFDAAGLQDAKFTTNVGTTRTFDPTSPYEQQRSQALAYLKSRVDITSVLGGDSIMSGPFLYPYGVFPLTDPGEPIWSDALQDWMEPRYAAARSTFRGAGGSTPPRKDVKLAIEPVKNWETPRAHHGLGGAGLPRRLRQPTGRRRPRHRSGRHGKPRPVGLQAERGPGAPARTGCTMSMSPHPTGARARQLDPVGISCWARSNRFTAGRT